MKLHEFDVKSGEFKQVLLKELNEETELYAIIYYFLIIKDNDCNKIVLNTELKKEDLIKIIKDYFENS